MYGILLVFHVIVAFVLIGLILVQHGKGAQAGAAFGSGASQTVFGSQGSSGFLTQATWTLAGVFFVTSITLAYLINKQTHFVRMSVPMEETKKGEESIPEVP